MSFWGLVTKVSERMEEEKTADGRNIKNNQEENKMYENEKTCAIGPGGAPSLPQEDLTNMLHETRAMAHEARKLAGIIGEHLFGNKNETICCDEEKCAEPVNFKETLRDIGNTIRETITALEKIRVMLGVR